MAWNGLRVAAAVGCAVLGVVVCVGTASGQDGSHESHDAASSHAMMGMPAGLRSTDAALLEGKPLAMFAPYIGDWEVNSEWGNGQALWARNEYRVLMGGAYVDAMTWAKDGEGEPYLRYYTVFTWDKDKKQIVSHGFQSDGSASVHEMSRAGEGADAGLVAEWGDYPQRIRQQVDMPVDGKYRWQVWAIPAEGADPMPMMEAQWVRQSAHGHAEGRADGHGHGEYGHHDDHGGHDGHDSHGGHGDHEDDG